MINLKLFYLSLQLLQKFARMASDYMSGATGNKKEKKEKKEKTRSKSRDKPVCLLLPAS